MSEQVKKNVLVFPCGSEIGLEIGKSLSLSTHFEVLGGSSVDDHGKYAFNTYIEGLPYVDDPSFITAMNAVIEKHKIDFIFPAHDSVLLKLAEAQAAGQLKCEVITSPLRTCEIARSKAKTYEVFSGVIPTPAVYSDAQAISPMQFPIFLKPNVGQGSKGTYVAKDADEVSFYTQRDPTLMLLEYLPGKEYTVDCFTDKNGKLLLSEGRVRARILNGISVRSSRVADKRFEELANKINNTVTFRGAWFFQVKENNAGELVLMEIAPRIAGTMGLIRCRGVNLVLLSLFDAMGYEVSVFENKYDMTIDRALQNSYKHNIDYKHVYIDFDDLIIFDGKVNPAAIAFVFQCRNKGVTVHLLTKHEQDLPTTLKQYRLNDVFDDIIWIKDGTPKSQYIRETSAILIDDSFAERQAVFEACAIPVFDSHMLESLQETF